MKEEPLHPWIEPELEARIVALVLGEASDFESEELERLIEEKAELAMFKKRMQAVHGLLREVATGESLEEEKNWKLGDEKRQALLAVIDGEEKSSATKKEPRKDPVSLKTATLKAASSRPHEKNSTKKSKASALSIAIIVHLGLAAVLMLYVVYSPAPQSPQFAIQSRAYSDSDDISSEKVMKMQKSRSVPTSPAHRYTINEADIVSRSLSALGSGPPTADAASAAKPDSRKESRASLSSIRGNLARYSPTAEDELVSMSSDTTAGFGMATASNSAVILKPEEKNANSLLRKSVSPGEVSGKESSHLEHGQTTPITILGKSLNVPQNAPLIASAGRVSGGTVTTIGGTTEMVTINPEMEVKQRTRLTSRSNDGATGGNISQLSELKVTVAREATMDVSGLTEGGQVNVGGGFQGKLKKATVPNEQIDRILEENINMPQNASLYASAGGSGTMTGVFTNAARSHTRAEFLQQVAAGWELPVPTRTRGDMEIGPNKPAGSKSAAEAANNSRVSRTKRSRAISPGAKLKKQTVSTAPKVTARNGGRVAIEQKRELINTKDYAPPQIPIDTNKQTMDKIYRRTPAVVGGGRRSGTTKTDKIEVTAGAPITLGFVKAKKNLSAKPSASASIQIKKSPVPSGLNEKSANDEAFSTFSLHVSDVSFKLAQAALAKGEWPETSKVRIEEFVNAFDYDDAMPNADEKVACRLEQGIHPFLQQRNLLRVSMRTAAAGRSSQTPLRLTFLLDNSGSMERSDRQQTVRRAFALLTAQLKPMDQVTLISFARQPRLLADQVSGAKANQLVQLIANLPSEGGTNLEAALQLAFEKAQEQQLDRAQNRIIMLTDGAANLGDADPEHLARMIEKMRDSGIAFDAAGIGADGLNDEILEALTRKGDGRYYLLDRPENADQGFARQIAGALRPAAKNVKVQIEFNPKRVGRYKLLGYEKHRLKKEDFRNDKVDAAEMAAAEAGVAIYQFEAKPDGEGDVGSVSVRFRDLSTGQMIENRWPIPYQADAPRLDQAAPSLRIASTAALFAAKLKGDPLANNVDFTALSQLIGGLPPRQLNNKRVQQLQQMINAARASNP